MAKLEVVDRKLSELKPYPDNSRIHDRDQMKQLENSIQEYGFTQPVLIDEDQVLLAGHARLEAAIRLKLKTIPTITIAGLTPAQKQAYVIADNQIAMNADWNFDILREQVRSLAEQGYDLSLTGFEQLQLASFLDPNAIDDPRSEWDNTMPEFNQDAAPIYRTVKVHFTNEDHVQKFAELIGQRIGEQTKFVWYPEMVRAETTTTRMVSEKSEAASGA